MDILYIIIGLVLLVLGGNWLLKGAVDLSLKLNISKIVVGLTVVSFATSAPELIVSIKSALDGYPDIAVGNVIGSNIGNIGLVLGAVLLINPIIVKPSFYKMDLPFLYVASFVLFSSLFFFEATDRLQALFYILVLVLFIFSLIRFSKKNKTVIDLDIEPESNANNYKIFGILVLGGVALWGGSELLVKGAVSLATSFGVTERIIAITVVSIGTSIPELASSIIAAVKKESDISVGNIVGSNIFNVLSVLGITSLIQPIEKIDSQLITQDIYWMLLFALILIPLCFLPPTHQVSKPSGLLLLLTYFMFLYFPIS